MLRQAQRGDGDYRLIRRLERRAGASSASTVVGAASLPDGGCVSSGEGGSVFLPGQGLQRS
jgi:hypothetical protein